MQSDIVQRLRQPWFTHGCAEYQHEAADEIERNRAEITRLTEALRLQMEVKHKEAAEAKLWFRKAQEWKDALRAAEEREKALREGLTLAANRMDVMALAVSHENNARRYEWHEWAVAARQALAGAKP